MHYKSLLKVCLSQATLPLLFCGVLYSIEFLFAPETFAGENSRSFFDNGSDQTTDLTHHPSFKIITEIRSGILACYQDLAQFLLMMLCLNVVIQIVTCIIFFVKLTIHTKEPSYPNEELVTKEKIVTWKDNFAVKLAQNVICYALIFSLIQIVAMTPILDNNNNSPISPTPLLRLLEERTLNGDDNKFSVKHDSQNEIKSLSLSIGKVLSSINIDPTSIILSKDEKYAFSMSHYYGILKVIDITNLKSPVVVTSMTLLKSQESRFKYGTLLLSEDGNTLFISNVLNLQIVNVQDPRSPVLLGKFQDVQVLNNAYYRTYPLSYKMSIVVSKDTTALYVAGMNMQFFEISDFTNPKLFNATTNADVLVSNYIEADHDRQLLFKAEKNLSVHSFGYSGNSEVLNASIPLAGGGSTSSFILSKDKRTLFVVSRQGTNTLYLEKLDISNITEIKSIHSAVLPLISYENPVIIALSPCENYLFLLLRETQAKDLTLRVYDISQRKAQITKGSLVKSTSCMLFSADNRILITATDKSFRIIELFIDFPNKRTFSLSGNSVMTFLGENLMNTIVLSPDQNTLFMCGGSPYKVMGTFQIADVSNQSDPKIVSIYPAKESFTKLHYISGASGIFGTIYLQSQDGFTFLDISNPSSPKLVGKYPLPEYIDRLRDSVLLKDTSLGMTLQSHMQGLEFNSTIKLLNFQNSSKINVEVIWSYPLPLSDNEWFIKLSHNEKTLYVMQKLLLIFDLDSEFSIKLRGSYNISSDSEKQQRVLSSALSKDDNIMFLKVEDDNSIFKLRIYDVSSNQNPPVFISEISLPLSVSRCTDQIALSPDSKRLYLAQLGSLLVIDVSDIRSPAILGIHKSFGLTSDHIDAFKIAEDGKSAYLVNFRGEIGIVRLESPYSLFIKQESFKLGEKYSMDTRLLRFNETAGYQPVGKGEYKPLKVSLLEIQAIETENPTHLTVSSLPYWINFDQENLLLNLEPKSEGDLGIYTVCTAFSTKLSLDAFNQITNLSNITNPEDLVISLVGLGYIDSKLFLTSEYGSFSDFLLPQQYQKIREDVHYVLSQYYMETCTKFDITRSLNLKSDSNRKLSIETPVTDYIKVEIKLTGKAKFLSLQDTHVQWLLGDEKSRLTIEGSAKDVNLAFKDVIVNFEKTDETNNATIVIHDYLNPPLTKLVSDVDKIFINNKEPKVNHLKSVQSQIDSVQISTGQYFTLTLDEETFTDLRNQTLTYQLSMEDNTLPSWLSFNNLVLRGTPPEEIFGREVPLILTAKNEYKNTTAMFTLRIKISPTYAAKLLIRFSPYILTVIGFWIFANKIYNILGKRRYKHTKEFYVEAGKEISSEVVFPIALIAEEKSESEVLMGLLKEFLKKKSDEGLVRCFIDSEGRLNKEKLLKALEESVVVAQEKNHRKTRLNLYLSEDESDRLAVTRLIWNQMILWQLNLKEEKSTLACFRRIKEKWSEMVEFTDEKYVINQEKFELFIEGKSPHSGLEARLLENNGLNVELLKEAILAHAFENQSLDVSAIDIQILGMQKISENSLRRFFRLDLERIDFSSKGKLGYGINYEISNEALVFLGNPEKRFKGKTLMVMIMNKKQKILKEISLHGVSSVKNHGSKSFLDVTGVSSSSSDLDKLRTSYNVL